MRQVLVFLLLLAAPAAAAEPYRDRPALRSVAFCIGVTGRMEVFVRTSPPVSWDKAKVEERAQTLATANAALLDYLNRHGAEASVTEEEGKRYIVLGLDLAEANFSNRQSDPDGMTVLLTLASLCSDLGEAIHGGDAAAISTAFTPLIELVYPGLPQ